MSMFTRRRSQNAIERQIALLRAELSDLGSEISRATGFRRRQSPTDYFSDFTDVLSDAMPVLRRQGRSLERQVRDHPVPVAAAVGLTLVAIAAAAYFSRR